MNKSRSKAGRFVTLMTSAALAASGTACSPSGEQGYTPPPSDATSFDIQFTQTASDNPEGYGPVDYRALLERQAANPVDVLELDGTDTPAETVGALNESGVYTMCYFNAGAAEEWRDDYGQFPAEALGKDYEGWEGEKWLDIRSEDVKPLIEARIRECADKGFKAIDPDNLDAYAIDSGFPLTRDDQIAYLRWLSETAHKHGLAIVLKNAPDLVGDVAKYFDGAVVESCHEWNECGSYRPLIEAGKPVFLIGYPPEGGSETELADDARLTATCEAAETHNFTAAVLKARLLTEQSKNCR